MEDDAFPGGAVSERKQLGKSTPRAKLPGEKREAKAASISPCESNGDEPRSKVWGEGTLTIEEKHEARCGNELEESAVHRSTDVDEQEVLDRSLSALTAKRADDCYPMSNSLTPAGKLNGWANTHDDEDWLEDFDKTPTSEPGSHKTCSTQWSEMESHSSGMESQLSGASGNSYGLDESSAMSSEYCTFLLFCRVGRLPHRVFAILHFNTPLTGISVVRIPTFSMCSKATKARGGIANEPAA